VSKVAYRADIDGLRAIAVLSVIGFHANPGLVPGGFVGVDIFFVISGFLISGLILNGLRDGSFSYLEFYGRRIRRLFPALIVVLLATWFVGWFVLPPTEYAALGTHTVAGALFGANILTNLEVGYFDVPAATKPLLHLWSLGVEEQFYIVFPALLVLLWQARRLRLFLTLIAVASFALNVGLVTSHPSFTFYLPLTRLWEFVAGGLLAWACLQPRELGPSKYWPTAPWWPDLSAALGLLLVVTAIAITGEEAFPGWWAVLPVFGAFFIIAAGPDAWINRNFLADRKLVFVGLISYPLYLWHWPLLVLIRTMMRSDDGNEYVRTTAIIAIALSLLLAWLTYKYIERPIRAQRPAFAARRIAVGLCASLAAVALFGFAVTEFGGATMRYPKELQALITPIKLGADYPAEDASRNSGGPLVVTYGDSHASHLQPGLRLLQNERTFRLRSVDWGWGCSPLGEVRARDEEKCRNLALANEKLFAELKPDIVVMAACWRDYHLERLADTLRFFQRIGVPRTVVVGSVPLWPQAPQTMLYKAYRSDPSRRIPERLFGSDTKTLAMDQQLRTITSDLAVDFVSAHDVLCNEEGCLVRVGDTAKDIVQVDLTHFSAAGSWFLVSHVANQIFADAGQHTSPRRVGSAMPANLMAHARPRIEPAARE
jgi:peptidoglycan/LPS O-acetylase OafA/YrhL